MLCGCCSKRQTLAPSLMDRLSSRFSIGNRLARLSTNWGLPDALARLGLADPSAPLQPALYPSPIAEEGSTLQDSDQGAMDHVDQSQSQPQPQQEADRRKAWEPKHVSVDGPVLQRQTTQQHKQPAASNEATSPSQQALTAQRNSGVSDRGADHVPSTGEMLANQTDSAVPASASSPAGRAAFASLGNTQSSPWRRSELSLPSGPCSPASCMCPHLL